MAPGSRALAFVSRWFDESTVKGVFEPLVADWQREWQDAPSSRRAWVSVRGWLAFVRAAINSGHRIILAPTPPSIAWRVTKRIAWFVLVASVLALVASVLLGLPFVGDLDGPWMLLLFLTLPSIVAVALPFSMIIAADAIRSHENLPAHVEHAAGAKLALGVMLVMLALAGWIMPAANLQWRNVFAAAAGRTASQPQPREQTIARLVTDAPPGRIVRAEINQRAALVVLPSLLLWLRWRALDLPRSRRGWGAPMPLGMTTAFAIIGYFLLFAAARYLEIVWRWPAGTAAWLPLLSMVFAAAAHQWWNRREMVEA